MFLLALFITSIQCTPVTKTPSPNDTIAQKHHLIFPLIFFDSRNGVIFQKVPSQNQMHKFEYLFNLTIQQAHGDPKKKCGRLTEENVTNEAWGKTMLNLRYVFYYNDMYHF